MEQNSPDYRISEIIIYPVKSLGGIHMQESIVQTEGLQYDRNWVLTSPEGIFISQREYPQLALFSTSIQGKFLQIHYQTETPLQVPLEEYGPATRQIQVWDDLCQAAPVSAEADAWFSRLLQTPCRLQRLTPETQRLVDTQYARQGETVSFADAMPVLCLGEASLHDLNKRLEQPVPMNRFRPNMVFSGGNAFDEDQWQVFEAGTARMKAVKPCARCVVTTVDQQNGRAGKEPLLTLARYRSRNNKVYFGQNILVLQEGIIRVGDRISLLP